MEPEVEPMLDSSETPIVIDNNANHCPNFVMDFSDETTEEGKPKVELWWHRLSYKISEVQYHTIAGIPYKRTTKSRVLIKDMSGRLVSGQMTAIIGPNGAGKSTLLNCLSGRRRKGLKGQVFVSKNG